MRRNHFPGFMIFAGALVCAAAGGRAAAQAITEFKIPTANSAPFNIVTGPDGALWFTEFIGNKIGRITTAGVVTEFSVPTTGANPFSITNGPDGNLWFTEVAGNKIGRITTAGVVTEFAATGSPGGITTGPDGALWFTEIGGNKIGRMTTSGTITAEFAVPTANAVPHRIAAGPDGALWVTEAGRDIILRMTTAGVATEFPTPTHNGAPFDITAGPDGALWFTEIKTNKVGRITVAGTVKEFTVGNNPAIIVAGPDGALWFSESNTELAVNDNKIGRLTTAGAFTEFVPPTAGSTPQGITVGPDKAIWFAEFQNNLIGRIPTPTLFVSPQSDIAAAGNAGGPFSPPSFDYTLDAPGTDIDFTISGIPDWLTATASGSIAGATLKIVTFTINANAGTLSPGSYGPATIAFTNTSSGIGNASIKATLTVGNPGPVSVFSAVLPASRSVQVGRPATAFSTVINPGGTTATNCGLGFGSAVPASFHFQTTDSTTNQTTGTINTPADIPPGGSQSYVVSITPNAAFDPTDVPIVAGCSNSMAAEKVTGLNTLLLSAADNPVPDVVALAASTDPGYVDLPGNTGTGAFSVASVNVGASGAITVSGDTGSKTLPVTITLCQTNSSAQCTNPATPAASVSLTVNANDTPTFSIFVRGSGAVANDPANNRVFVRFKDAGGVTRGATSVAVKTQ